MRYDKSLVYSAAALSILAFLLIPRYLKPSYPGMLLSLAYFTLLLYSLGYSVTKDVYEAEPVESIVMRVGFGLAALPLVFTVLDAANLLIWYVPLALSLIRPSLDFIRGWRPSLHKPRFGFNASAALLIAALMFTVALYGSYVYPYLEDGDPWEHAVGVKYVSLFHTYTKPEGVYVAHYIKPYPPAYDTLLGLTHQLNTSVSWTMKAFNSVLVGLSYAFAFFFAKKMAGPRTALFAVLVLAALPPFGSHSIWAHTMAAAALFPVFYSVEHLRSSRRWLVPSAVMLGGSLIMQPLMSFVFGVFLALYALPRVLADRSSMKTYASLAVLGLLLSMVYWLPIFTNPVGDLEGVGAQVSRGDFRIGVKEESNPSAAQVLFPATHGDIFMHEGYGLFAVLLVFMALDHVLRTGTKFLSKNPWFASMFLWLAFSTFLLHSSDLPVAMWPQRFWGIGAIPLSMLAGFTLANLGRIRWIPPKFTNHVLAFLVAGLLLTSAYPKLVVQTKQWPSDLGKHMDGDIKAYTTLQYLQPDMPVYPLCVEDKFVVGMDKLSAPWKPEITGFRDGALYKSAGDIHSFLDEWGFQYATADIHCIKKCVDAGGAPEDCYAALIGLLRDMRRHPGLTLEYRDNSTGVFSVS